MVIVNCERCSITPRLIERSRDCSYPRFLFSSRCDSFSCFLLVFSVSLFSFLLFILLLCFLSYFSSFPLSFIPAFFPQFPFPSFASCLPSFLSFFPSLPHLTSPQLYCLLFCDLTLFNFPNFIFSHPFLPCSLSISSYLLPFSISAFLLSLTLSLPSFFFILFRYFTTDILSPSTLSLSPNNYFVVLSCDYVLVV